MKNITYGYARVSTKGQNLDRQIKNLRDYGIEERNIITDTCTGVNFRRTGYNALSKVLLKKGDTLVIPSIDRLGRNKKSTEKAYNNLVDKGVKIVFLEDSELNSDVCKDKDLAVSTYMAEKEYKKIKKRQRQGIDAMPIDGNGKKYSIKTGKHIGRPLAEYPSNFEEVYNKWKSKDISSKEVIEESGLKKATFYNLCKRYEQENNL
ncbi:MAG: recombinase family protein [Peptostreptococcaceae bacterium]|mgnify:FL=1|uniref:recombinase family protein n=1 Tax=Intestinibacter bartlettii TaxID=261299 RepID=UPI00290486E1|nr:recombinase family protein [Intestinibacter bartlettii]MDU1255467.1 recombinase family protein [Peptostreptococcaceae bacterium]MDU6198503.1 recombinase family protein [Intestinibacter bartlettii]